MTHSSDDIPEDLRLQLRKIEHAGDAIVGPFAKELNGRTPPSVLYHYTNDVGLKGILETGKIWLTNVFDLNDPSEITHGISFAVDRLKAKAAGAPAPVAFFADVFARFPQEGVHAAAHFFVCSLSSKGNDLDQWRSYADDGRGFAIGFDAKALTKAFHKDASFACASFPVTYGDSQLVRMQTALVDAAFPLLLPAAVTRAPIEVQKKYYIELGASLSVSVLTVALFFKHEAYRNEMEYRLLKMRRADEPPPGAKLRTRQYTLGKYIELDWCADTAAALKEIIVGPAANVERVLEFARDCLVSFGRPIVTIKRSEIPYRAG